MNTFPIDRDIYHVTESVTSGVRSLSSITIDSLFNMTWHMRPQVPCAAHSLLRLVHGMGAMFVDAVRGSSSSFPLSDCGLAGLPRPVPLSVWHRRFTGCLVVWLSGCQVGFVAGPRDRDVGDTDEIGLVQYTIGEAFEFKRMNAWGKGLMQPTAFRFQSQWMNTTEVSLCCRHHRDRVVSLFRTDRKRE